MRKAATGFTIVELMIVVTIVAILASLALPAFTEFIRNNRRTTAVNEVLASLLLARSEATKRGQPVTVCGNTSTGGVSCTGGTSWTYGWMVFVDPNGDGAIAATGDMIRRYVNESGEIKVRSNGAGPVVMRPFNQASTNATIAVCDKRGSSKARAVIVASTGRARVAETDAAGAAISCP